MESSPVEVQEITQSEKTTSYIGEKEKEYEPCDQDLFISIPSGEY